MEDSQTAGWCLKKLEIFNNFFINYTIFIYLKSPRKMDADYKVKVCIFLT